jgi:membrane-associated protease RseP (regulator of RpoE activity)
MKTTGIDRSLRAALAVTGALALLGGGWLDTAAQERERTVQVWSVSTEPGGWIGISLTQTAYTMASGDVIADVTIDRVWEGSPAEEAGIMPGDRIIRINGEAVDPARSMEQLKSTPGQEFTLVLLRGGEEVTVELVTAERPGSFTMVQGANAVTWNAEVDSLTRKILVTADSLKVGLRLLDGEGRAVFRADSLVAVGPEGVASTVRIRRGDGEEIHVVRPGGETSFRFRVPEADEPAPFGVFIARTPRTDSLLTQRSQLRDEIEKVRRTEVARKRELAAESGTTESRVSERDPRLAGLIRTREQLTAELVVVEEELARAGLEGLARRTAAPDAAGEVYVRTLPEPPRVRAVSPYLFGERFVAGAELTNLNPQLAEYFPVSEGVLVTEVVPGSPAYEAGLKGGDVIIRVGDTEVDSVNALRQALSRAGASGPTSITVAGRDGTRTIELKR